MKRILSLLIFGLVLQGCASSGQGLATGSRNVILREELVENPAVNAYDLVQSLRPQWLRIREEFGIGRANDLVVYLDHARLGGRDALREISVGNIQYLQYLEPAAANLRFGAGHAYGAILVSTHASIR